MAIYTTQIRTVIQNQISDLSLPIYTQIDQAKGTIFDFEYPIWAEDYRAILERKILAHYFMYEIGFETLPLFKLNLQNRLNEIMPYYNQLYATTVKDYDYLNDVNLTETFTGKEITDDTHTTDFNSQNKATNTTTVNNTGQATNENTSSNSGIHSDFPQAKIGSTDYATYQDETSGTSSDTNNYSNEGTSNNDLSSNTTNKGTDQIDTTKDNTYTKKVTGKNGGASFTQLLIEYRQSLMNIDKMIIDDLYDLFMLVY